MSELRRQLHSLWTKAVGTPGYDKLEWIEFERVIRQLEEDAKRAKANA